MYQKIVMIIAIAVFFISFKLGCDYGKSQPISIKESATVIKFKHVNYEK